MNLLSNGEILDKYSVLQLKKEYITEPEKLLYINTQLVEVEKLVHPVPDLYNPLHELNRRIWTLNIKLRNDKTDLSSFQELFKLNEQKYDIRNKINESTSSPIREQKSYKENSTVIHYIMGGFLGDFIHHLYVVMVNYKTTGKKGVIHLTDNFSPNTMRFLYDIKTTYKALYPLVNIQPYIHSFKLLDTVPDEYIDLTRVSISGPQSWSGMLEHIHNIPHVQEPWLCNIPLHNKFKNKIIIHRNIRPERHISTFPWSDLVKANDCVFVTSDIREYEAFPYKDFVDLYVWTDLLEAASIYYSSKFFIGNQSSPLAFCAAMHKPCLVELSTPERYINEYPTLFWWTYEKYSILHLEKYISISSEELSQDVDPFHIVLYFTNRFRGTCLELGCNITFNRTGWTCKTNIDDVDSIDLLCIDRENCDLQLIYNYKPRLIIIKDYTIDEPLATVNYKRVEIINSFAYYKKKLLP